MDRFVIESAGALSGEVQISGAKNAALPIVAATILADGECSIGNVPFLKDVEALCHILGCLGVEARRDPEGRIACEVVTARFAPVGLADGPAGYSLDAAFYPPAVEDAE